MTKGIFTAAAAGLFLACGTQGQLGQIGFSYADGWQCELGCAI